MFLFYLKSLYHDFFVYICDLRSGQARDLSITVNGVY